MRCSRCGGDNREGAKFCRECSSPLSKTCAACGALNLPGAKFCDECGASVDAHPSALTVSPGQPAIRVAPEQPEAALQLDGERKTVTALFADIKGSMELMEDLDPEEARSVIDPALKLMIDAVQRYGGFVVQSTGDGIFALFGAPIAFEDHPQRALYGALRMQEDMRRYGDHMRTQGQMPLQVRIGVNTGEVVVRPLRTGAGQTEYTPIGHSISLTARLQTLATPGSTVISGYTRGFVEGYFQLKSLGPTIVKGASEPVQLYEVTGLGPLRTRLQVAARRGFTRFVGREREMKALRHASALAREGRGQIVAAVAEPGVGKSRLFYEFKATSASGWIVLEALSISHGKASAYLPVIDLLRNYFEISAADDERKRREKVAGKVTVLDRNLEDTLPYLFSLLGIVEGDDPLVQTDGQIKKRRTLEAIKRIVVRESLNQPLMVIFEDLHWMDGESAALLNLLADSIATSQVLLLVNYRPEYSHKWGSKTFYTQLRLDPLGKESADEMLSTLLGSDGNLAPLKRLIAEKTEGNPLFMEEIALRLFEDGTLTRNGEIKLAKPLASLRIPPTVQGILASRIDRLPADEKDLLQTVAVIGTDFNRSAARSISGKSDDDLDRTLNNLQLAEFIYEQPAEGDVEYTFKHALTHEVAYNSILLQRRKQIHERTASALETLHTRDRPDFLGEMARHYSRSDNVGKAVEYLTLAGEQSAARSAFTEAATYTRNALELVPRLAEGGERDRAELRLQLALAAAQATIAGWGSSDRFRSLERAGELCDRIGEKAEIFPVLWHLCQSYMQAGRYGQATKFADKSMQLAEDEADRVKLMLAHYNLGECNFRTGNFTSSRWHLERALETFDDDLDMSLARQYGIDVSTASSYWLSLNSAFAGWLDQALQHGRSAVTRARARGVYNLTLALLALSGVYVSRREPEQVIRSASEAIALCAQYAFHELEAFLKLSNGWASAALGRSREGIGEVISGVKETEEAGSPNPAFAMVSLAATYLIAGYSAEALCVADEGLQMVARTGEHSSECPLLFSKGEALARIGRVEEAGHSLSAAIDLARKQEAKLYELWATTSLARLLASQERREEAHSKLAEIYNWFTEGFDTADLREAKALLDELSR